MSLLIVNGICKAFGGLAAVSEVSFKIDEGQIISIIGPNGAGKTTVFNLLTGFYTCDKGEINLEGKNIKNLPPASYVRNKICRTFQNLRVFTNLTAFENVLIGYQSLIQYNWLDAIFKTRKFRQQEKIAAQKTMQIIDKIGLSEYAHIKCNSLPYGILKKLEIARAMVSNPKLILLDEPAAGLNPQETDDLAQFIKKMPEMGFSVLLIEHDMGLVMKISDYIYVMDYGKVIAKGVAKDIQSNEQVIEAYIGKGGLNHVAKGE